MNRIVLAATTLAALLVAEPATALQPPKKQAMQRAVPSPSAQPLPPAGSEQLAAAAMTLFGNYACEFGKSLRVSPDPRSESYVDLQFDKQRITLKPVMSSTGALRLEDVRGRVLLLQIATKSMVMDVKVGQRLADDCVHETQAETRRRLAAEPPRPVLGLVSEPDKGPGPAADMTPAAAPAPTPTAAASAPAATPARGSQPPGSN